MRRDGIEMLLNCEAVHIFYKLLSFIHLSIKKLSLFTFITKARSKKIIQHRFKEEVSMNNYDPYDPNQNQSYGDPQNTINGQGGQNLPTARGGGQGKTPSRITARRKGFHLSFLLSSLLIKT